MKRMLSIVGSLLGLLVLVGLTVVLAMTFGALRRGAQPGLQAFQSSVETPTLLYPTHLPPHLPPFLRQSPLAPLEVNLGLPSLVHL